ncbi:unnamed protein product [Mesocestoides corti]|uniref:Uncharacterized protein n=1 Tax=Mesocestoides corti TaxID=53468 RepID=A0A0R3U353_MESCO|nr:unnamed protein product [Mesocestoides corti]
MSSSDAGFQSSQKSCKSSSTSYVENRYQRYRDWQSPSSQSWNYALDVWNQSSKSDIGKDLRIESSNLFPGIISKGSLREIDPNELKSRREFEEELTRHYEEQLESVLSTAVETCLSISKEKIDQLVSFVTDGTPIP